jgi:hypothetical protein
MRLTIGSAILVIGLGLAGCGQSSTTTVATPEGTVRTSADGSTTTLTGASGPSATFGAGATATQLPDFLPLYPGAKVLSSINAPQAGMQGGSVAFETNASPAEVVTFYKQKAAAQGLAETLSSTETDGMTYMASKDQTMVQVIASKGTNSTEIVLSWTAPKAN